MQNYLQKEEVLMTSKLDFRGKLTMAGLFELFMDLAAEHAGLLHVGFEDMLSHRAFWLAVRTRVRIRRLPGLGDRVTVRTWPGKPGSVKCDRFYTLQMGETLLAEGRTEWTAQHLDTGRLLRTNEYGYPVDLQPLPERVCAEPFTRFREIPDEANFLTTYTVQSKDIDTGMHVNNVAYVRLLMSTFTVAELGAMDIEEAEIAYASACREGEELALYRHRDAEGFHFLIRKPDDSTAVQMALRLRATGTSL